MRWLYVVAAATVLMCAFGAARLSLDRPIGEDEAYNLQIAKSIGTSFCYCTRYRPERVFPVEESSNGPFQYVGGALFAVTQSPDAAKTGTVAVGILILGAALLLLDPWLVFLALALFFVWPWFHMSAISYEGEIFAVAFALLGLLLLRRKSTFFAIVCFGAAVESKLIAVIAILPAAWAVVYGLDPDASAGRRALRATRTTAIVAGGTALVLFLLIAASIVHSARAIDAGAIWQTFIGHILNMIGQGQGATRAIGLSSVAQSITQFESAIVLTLFLFSAAILLWLNPGYVFFLIATFTWWLYFGKTERHLVISLFVTIVLAAVEGHARLKRRSLPVLAVVAGVAAAVGFMAHSSFNVVPPKHFADREHVVAASGGRMVYSKQLVDVLRQYPYVLTSGWWQFPELALRENLEFYDRTSPANADVPRDKAVLFFDEGNRWFPATTIRGNCERVLYAEAPLIVCSPRRNVPLAFQPITR